MTRNKKIAFQTLGCKLNFSETSTISRQFGQNDFSLVSFDEHADIYVINSCSVTRNAEKRCKEMVRQVLKRNPDARVAIIGCYSQLSAHELSQLPGVDLVLGNADKFDLFERIEAMPPRGEHVAGQEKTMVEQPDRFVSSYSADDRTRSFFKVQDGCDYFCSYCTIPMARGRSRSDSIAGTLEVARQIAQTHMKEVVLSGVNIGDFGKQHGESFLGLLSELVKVEGLHRIRISSVEPNLLSDEIIELVADTPNLMPHFHIPLQSGSDKVLKAMKRRYDTSVFASRVEKIKKTIPHACIAADLIVGFPLETQELYEESEAFIRQTDVSYVHVFTYSERDNTQAVKYNQQVPVKERKQRSRRMQEVSQQKKTLFYEQHKGHTSNVLWEKEENNDWMYGFTENYIRVKTPFRQEKANTIEKVTLNLLDSDGVFWV